MRWGAADGIKKEALGEQTDHGIAEPRTPRAEETLKERNEHGERVRRRKFTARVWRERRQRGMAAGNSMNIIAALGVRTLELRYLNFGFTVQLSHTQGWNRSLMQGGAKPPRNVLLTVWTFSPAIQMAFERPMRYSVTQGISTPEAWIGDGPGSVSRDGKA